MDHHFLSDVELSSSNLQGIEQEKVRQLFGSFMPTKRPQSAGPSKVIKELTCYLNESPVDDKIQKSGPLQS